MAKFTGTAGYDATFTCSGTGSTVGGATAELCQVSLSANERAAFFTGTVVSDTGQKIEVTGLGAMVPDEGWYLYVNSSDPSISLTLVGSPSTTVLLSVTGGECNWSGWLSVTFTQNYSA